MGADIDGFLEIKRNGKWEKNEDKIFEQNSDHPFENRSYAIFGFLAGVRNYSNCEIISERKGLPLDSEYLNTVVQEEWLISYTYTLRDKIIENPDYHSLTYLTLQELIDFDYEKQFEDRRTTRINGLGVNGAAIVDEGEGIIKTYREFLGEWFFKDLETMKTLGEPENVRFVFWFDN